MRAANIPLPTEDQEQAAVARYLDARRALWCHVPNGGNRDAITGARLKRLGAKAGVPDILVFGPVRCAIELKRRKGGRLSPEQSIWLAELERSGFLTQECHGADEAIAKLREWGI